MYKATEVFGKWAEEGKDIGMEEGHSASVNEMLNFALKERREKEEEFSFLDIGCGNGWGVRKVTQDSLCLSALGLDGAEQMIANAKSRGVESTGSFIKSPLGVKTNISSSNISIFNKSISSSGSEFSLLRIESKSLNQDTCESNSPISLPPL